MFTPFESQQSSTFGKLKANFYVIQAYAVSVRRKKSKFSLIKRTLPEFLKVEKSQTRTGFEPMTSAMPVQRSTN